MWQCKYCDSWNSDNEKVCPICDKSRSYSYVMTLTKTRVDKLGLTGEVVIPKDFNVIGEGAFKSRADIYAVIIHSGVKKISQEAFFGCVNLIEVKCEGELSSISSKAFGNCLKLSPENYPSASRFTAQDAFYVNEELSRMDNLIASLGECVQRYKKIELTQRSRGDNPQKTQERITAITDKISEAKAYKENLARGIANSYNIVLYASIVSSEVIAVTRAEEGLKAVFPNYGGVKDNDSNRRNFEAKKGRRIRKIVVGISIGLIAVALITIFLLKLL